MSNGYDLRNLCFAGGGVLGIAYMGVLEYLYQNQIIRNIDRVSGASAGAIAACLTSFSLDYKETKAIMDTLDYSKVPQRDSHSHKSNASDFIKTQFESLLGDFDSIHRLLNNYGWYSTNYFYTWLQDQIQKQFDYNKKKPPYTFRDFMDSSIHIDNREFKELYIIGTDISMHESRVFSFVTSPDMEVAKAVQISMSIPLYFESVKLDVLTDGATQPTIFSDGGVMWNYPINLFDEPYLGAKSILGTDSKDGVNKHTFGAKFDSKIKYSNIKNLIQYIENLIGSFLKIQEQIFRHNENDVLRTIVIDTGDISFVDFNIKPGDDKYNFLMKQGYDATSLFFSNINSNPIYR